MLVGQNKTATKVFPAKSEQVVQFGHNAETIIGSAYSGVGFCGRNSTGFLLINFGF